MRIAILQDDPSQLELLGHWIVLGGHHAERFEYGEDLLKAIPGRLRPANPGLELAGSQRN